MKTGWQMKPLEQVCTLQRGFDLPATQRTHGSTPLVSSSGVIDGVDQSKVDGPGVVTGRSGSIGAVFFIDEPFWPLNTTLYVKDFHGNDERFIFYLLTSLGLSRFASGTGVPTLNRNHLAAEPIMMPPVEEQRRIVAVLDEVYAAADVASVNAQKNLRNARELSENVISTWLSKIDAPRISLSDACARVTVGHVGTTSPHYRTAGIPFLRTQNVSREGINLNELVYITPEFHRSLSKSALRSGDLLISRVVTNMINVGIVPPSLGEANCANVICVRPGAAVDPQYLTHLIRAEQSQRELLGRRKGSAQQVVNTSVLKNWRVPVPTLKKQQELIYRLDEHLRLIDDLDAAYRTKRSLIDELKQSLLDRAFSGELTGRERLAA